MPQRVASFRIHERASSSAVTIALWIVAVVAVTFFLRAAEMLLIPIALAVLVSYALAPAVSWLERRRMPRLVAAGLVLLCAVAAGAGGVYSFSDDARDLVETLPRAVERAREELSVRLGGGTEAIEAATRLLQTTENTPASSDAGSTSPAAAPANPLLQRLVGAMFTVAGDLVVIVFLVYFLLISGHALRNRMLEVVGPGRQAVVATIIDEVNAQIQRYLVVLLVTAILVGTATWAVLSLQGVRHAATWGILAGVFNSMPYFGPVIVSGGLFVVGLVQGSGLTQALQMSGASIVITSLEGWLLTPALMGRAERMSALSVFLGVLLWTWIWGPWGTVLAVPMLVIIKSVADHVEPLRPLGRLMAP